MVTSFLEGRRRFASVLLAFSILETNEECLIVRLSFFVVAKTPSAAALVDVALGREPNPEHDVADWPLFATGLDLTGAWKTVRQIHLTRQLSPPLTLRELCYDRSEVLGVKLHVWCQVVDECVLA